MGGCSLSAVYSSYFEMCHWGENPCIHWENMQTPHRKIKIRNPLAVKPLAIIGNLPSTEERISQIFKYCITIFYF